MDVVSSAELKNRYMSKLLELEEASLQISKLVEAIIEHRVLDKTVALQDAKPAFEISLAASRMLDASHLSMSLHAYYSAKLQNIDLKLPEDPPQQLDVVGRYFFLPFLATTNLATPQSSWQSNSRKKRRLGTWVKWIFFQILNSFVRLTSFRNRQIVLYGTLYNVQPSLSSISDAFHMMKNSLAQKLVAIEYLSNHQLTMYSCTPKSTTLRSSLESSLSALLDAHFPHLRSERDRLANFLAKTVPISNLEERTENFRLALRSARALTPKIVISANGFASEKHTSFLAAACKQACNSTIIGIQHGGYYGYTRCHGHPFNTEYQFLDYLVTWGWDKRSTSLGTLRTKAIPSGSLHLYTISRKQKLGATRDIKQSVRPRILFVAGPWLKVYARCEQHVGQELVHRYIYPSNAEAIAKLALQVHGDLYLKGGYVKDCEDEYFRQIALSAKDLGVECKQIDSKLSAFKIYQNYDLIIFDSLGTGFFESVTMDVPTLLLPSARMMPLRESSETLSDKFFTDNFDGTAEILSVFSSAKTASSEFLESYGKVADSEFFAFLKNSAQQIGLG